MSMKQISQVSAQDIQDAFFRKMTADEKVLFGAQLWRLGYDLAKNKITYASHRSARTSRQHSKNA